MKLITEGLLDKVTDQAKENSRLRMNYNFHDSMDAPIHRMLNALEPGTELPVHRHCFTAETYIVLRGEINVFFYDDDKRVTESVTLNPLKGEYGIHIPAGQWHTLEVVEKGTVIFEVKDGPYRPLGPEDRLD